jgi:hypothetical protein
MMRNIERCHMNSDKCEDCVYWEPIPFHQDSGVCMSRKTLNVVPSNTIVSVKRQKKPVYALADT